MGQTKSSMVKDIKVHEYEAERIMKKGKSFRPRMDGHNAGGSVFTFEINEDL